MKRINILMIVAFLMLLLFVPLMAQVVEPGGGMNIENIIIYLTPFLVFGVGQLAKLVNKNVKGVWLLVIVGTSSGVLAWVVAASAGAETWFLQFAYGLLSVVFHQFYKQLKSGN